MYVRCMARSLRLARWATFLYFGLNGFVMGMWVVHIPVIENRVGVSHAELGWLLLLLGAGAFAGMQLAGPLTDRLGLRIAVPAGAVLCSASLALPGLATGAAALGGALVVFGFGNGCLDVAMNAHAVHVERAYRRPVMSAFHAVFSIGGVLAALVCARTLSRGLPPEVTLGVVAALGTAAGLLAAPALLRTARPEGVTKSAGGRRRRPRTPARTWALAALALVLMLAEGVANDWSTLHLRDSLDAPAATAALAYGAFATAMTAGRLLADRVAGRFGAVAVLRYGSAVAAAGLGTAALSPWTAAALAGWGLFGLGLSGCVPQLFSAAGHAEPENAATNVSRVAGLGYLGMLAGPALIGALTHLAPLNLVLLLPVALCVVGAAAAGILHTGTEAATGTGSGADADAAGEPAPPERRAAADRP